MSVHNKKGQGIEQEMLVRVILWIVFALVAGAAVYFVLKKLTA